MSDCKVVDEIVERGAHVMEAVPDEQAEFGGGLVKDFHLHELISSLRVEFSVDSIRMFFEPRAAFGFQALQVLPGPF